MFWILLTIVLLVWFVKYKHGRKRMYELAALVKGPKELPLIGSLHYWFGDNIVIVNPADVDYILKYRMERDDLHRFMRKFIGSTEFKKSAATWKPRRKRMTKALAPKCVTSFFDIFTYQCKKLVTKLEEKEHVGEFKMLPLMKSHIFSTLYDATFGGNTNEEDKLNTELYNLIHTASKVVVLRVCNVWLQPDWLFRFFPLYQEQEDCANKAHARLDEVIQSIACKTEKAERLEAERPSFLQVLIEETQDIEGFNVQSLREELIPLLVAGMDTTAGACGYCLKLLAVHPDTLEKVHSELDNVFLDSERDMVPEDLTKLVYLDCVVKETLRLYPPVSVIQRKITTETELPSGTILPAGCGVLISIFGIQRDPQYWGHDAEKFDPERFMPERAALINPGSYIPFSAGPKNCIGYQFALKAIKTVLSTILRKYDLRSSDKNTSIPVRFDLVMNAVDETMLSIHRRSTLSN